MTQNDPKMTPFAPKTLKKASKNNPKPHVRYDGNAIDIRSRQIRLTNPPQLTNQRRHNRPIRRVRQVPHHMAECDTGALAHSGARVGEEREERVDDVLVVQGKGGAEAEEHLADDVEDAHQDFVGALRGGKRLKS